MPTLRFTPPRPRGAASIASTSLRCTARRPSASSSKTTSGRRSSAASCRSHYQPIVHAAGEEISGFEALVRWQHPTRGPISPAMFVPLAEEAGLIGKIGEWVLRTALEEAAKWPDHVRIAVNLSPLQFNDPGVVAMVAEHLKANRRPRRAAGARDHRGRVSGRGRDDRRHVRQAEGARRPPRARRFRHRLFARSAI